MAVSGQHEAMQRVGARAEARMQDAARIAGGLCGELRSAFDQGDGDTALRKGMSGGAAGDAAADDEGGAGVYCEWLVA